MGALDLIERGELTFVVGTCKGLALRPQREVRDEILRLAKLGQAALERFECHRQPYLKCTIIIGGFYCTDCSDLDFCKLRKEGASGQEKGGE